MKNKSIFILLLALVSVSCLVIGCAAAVTETCNVKIPKGAGYVVNGAKTVEKGKDYVFTVTANEGYDIASVTVGTERLTATDGKYTIANVTADIEISVSAQRKTFSVFFVGEGYEASGEPTVTYGSNYVFTLTISDGYDKTVMPVVKADNDTLVGEKDGNVYVYTIQNVTSDVTVTVSDLVKLPGQLVVPNEVFNLEIAKLTAEQRNQGYYLQGVSGSYNGAKCNVNVDLSSVVWNTAGSYTITYSLEGHSDVTKVATLKLFGTFVVSDIAIDLSDVTAAVSCLDGYQYVDRDLYIVNGETQTLLTPKQFVAEQIVVDGKKVYRSHFSTDYLLSLKSGSYNFRLVDYVTCNIGEFTVTLTDDAAPAYDFDADDMYAYVVGDSFDFVKTTRHANSAQPIVVKYFLTDGNGVETDCTDGYDLPNKAGGYTWTVKYFRSENELTEYTKSVKYLLVDNYGWSGATVSASKDGNIVLSTVDGDPNQYTDKNAAISAEYIRKNNTVNGNYMVVTFKVTDYTSSGKFDAGIWSLKGANNDYMGITLNKVGDTHKVLRMLSGGSVDFIIRDFTGSLEIVGIEFVTIADGFGNQKTNAGYVNTTTGDNGLVTSAKVQWTTNSDNNKFSITQAYLDKLVAAGYTQLSMDLSATQTNIYVICTYKNGNATKDVAKNYTGGNVNFALNTVDGTLSEIGIVIVNTHDNTVFQDFSGTLELTNITYTK